MYGELSFLINISNVDDKPKVSFAIIKIRRKIKCLQGEFNESNRGFRFLIAVHRTVSSRDLSPQWSQPAKTAPRRNLLFRTSSRAGRTQ